MSMRDIVNRVYDFNEQIVGVETTELKALGSDQREWLYKVLVEEADELHASVHLVDQVDAIADSIIFAIGGFKRMGLERWQAIAVLSAVMDANFQKKAGQKAGRVVGDVKDAVKPADFVGPEVRIAEILGMPR